MIYDLVYVSSKTDIGNPRNFTRYDRPGIYLTISGQVSVML